MKWYDKFYISDNLYGTQKQVKQMVFKKKKRTDLFVIVESDNPNEMLFMIPAVFLKKDNDYSCVGVAKGYFHGLHLMKHIINDCYSKTGSFDFRTFFEMEGV